MFSCRPALSMIYVSSKAVSEFQGVCEHSFVVGERGAWNICFDYSQLFLC